MWVPLSGLWVQQAESSDRMAARRVVTLEDSTAVPGGQRNAATAGARRHVMAVNRGVLPKRPPW